MLLQFKNNENAVDFEVKTNWTAGILCTIFSTEKKGHQKKTTCRLTVYTMQQSVITINIFSSKFVIQHNVLKLFVQKNYDVRKHPMNNLLVRFEIHFYF